MLLLNLLILLILLLLFNLLLLLNHLLLPQVGYILEDDVKLLPKPQKELIDRIIDHGPCPAGQMEQSVVQSLYMQGLVYLDIIIDDQDCMIVPPLEGFVMNRVTGDYFETLLYKIFVSMDESSSVAEMASLLQIDIGLVKDAVSLYCRYGTSSAIYQYVVQCTVVT